jgi:hypothetical protein
MSGFSSILLVSPSIDHDMISMKSSQSPNPFKSSVYLEEKTFMPTVHLKRGLN